MHMALEVPPSLAGGTPVPPFELVVTGALLMSMLAVGDRPIRGERFRYGAMLAITSMSTSLTMAGLLRYIVGFARPATNRGDPWWISPFA